MAVHGDAGDDQHGLKVHSVLDLDLDGKNPVPMDTDVNEHQTAPMDLDLDATQAEPAPSRQATGAAIADTGQDGLQPVSVGDSLLPQPGQAKAATSSGATQPATGPAATDSSAAQPSSSGAGQQDSTAAAPFAAAAATERSSVVAAAAAATSPEPPGFVSTRTEVVDLTEEAFPESCSADQGKTADVLLPGEAWCAAAHNLLPLAAAKATGTLLPHAAVAGLARCCLMWLPDLLLS